ncbi:MAG: hypothetical protein AAGB34_01015, partial [Planctomycetota bacterium]
PICRNCGYDLTGLAVGTRCPECGTAYTLSNRERRIEGRWERPMNEAPRSFLWLLALGLWMMFAGLVGGVLIDLILRSTNFFVVFGLELVAAGGWVVGVWIVTSPRPKLTKRMGGHSEWPLLRWSSRLSQLAYLSQAVVGVIVTVVVANTTQAAGGASPSLTVTALQYLWAGVGIVAALGLIPLSVYVSYLADWASDLDVAEKLRGGGWFLTFFSIVLILSQLMFAVNFLKIFAIIGMVLSGLGLAITTVVIVIQFARLASSVLWAIKNVADMEQRDLRRAERDARQAEEENTKQRELEEKLARAGMPPTPQDPVLQPSSNDTFNVPGLEDTAPAAEPTETFNPKQRNPNEIVVGDDSSEVIPYELEDDEEDNTTQNLS